MKLSEIDLESKDTHPNIKKIMNDSLIFPQPIEVDATTGKGMWEFHNNKVWADCYGDAMNMYHFIRVNSFYGTNNSNNDEKA